MISSNQQQAPQKKSRGRQKMKMQKMENESNLKVTFSKRRAGIFKKASELCVLCAAEALIIIFSPAKKAFSYGHPDVELIASRFLYGDDPDATATDTRIDNTARKYSIRTRNLELTQMRNLLDMERKRGEELDAAMKNGMDEGWIPPPLDDFNLEQLEFFDKAVSNFQNHLNEDVAKFKSLNLNPTPEFNGTNELYATGDRSVTNNISSSVFYPNNNPSLLHGLNNVATRFNDTGLLATGGISAANNMAEVPFPSEFNSWAAGFCDSCVHVTGQTSLVANNVGTLSVPADFNTWAAGFCANNAGKVPEQIEFSNWAQGFGSTGAFATGETSAANSIGAFTIPDDLSDWSAVFCNTDTSGANNVNVISEQNKFNNWAPNFGNTGAFTTGETSDANNVGAIPEQNEFNNWTPGETSGANIGPNDPFTAPTNPMFSLSSLFPGFNDYSGPSQL